MKRKQTQILVAAVAGLAVTIIGVASAQSFGPPVRGEIVGGGSFDPFTGIRGGTATGRPGIIVEPGIRGGFGGFRPRPRSPYRPPTRPPYLPL